MDTLLDLFQRHSLRLAAMVSTAMVVLMSLSIANTVLFFVENIPEGTPAQTSPATQSAPRSTAPQIDLSSLNLFGKVEDQNAAPVVVDAPVTKLNLELQGVFIAGAANDSTAIIAEARKPGELFRVGDRLPGNAILSSVLEDHVLLKRGSRYEKLMFKDSSSGGVDLDTAEAAPAAARSTPSGRSTSDRLQQARERILNRKRNTSSRPSSPNSIRSYIGEYRERIQSDPYTTMQELGISPVEDGSARGYRVGGDIGNRALQQAGLQQGDIILSVNGRPVGDAANDPALIDSVMAAKRVRVEVQRNKRRFFLTVPLP